MAQISLSRFSKLIFQGHCRALSKDFRSAAQDHRRGNPQVDYRISEPNSSAYFTMRLMACSQDSLRSLEYCATSPLITLRKTAKNSLQILRARAILLCTSLNKHSDSVLTVYQWHRTQQYLVLVHARDWWLMASTRASRFCARLTTGTSTILPSRSREPRPADSAWFQASITRWA